MNLSDLKQLPQWIAYTTDKVPINPHTGRAASSNDPLGEYQRIAQLASDWHSELVNVGEVGHLNPAAGFGEWPRASELIAQLEGR